MVNVTELFLTNMEKQTLYSIVISIIAAVILTGLTINWLYRVYLSKYITKFINRIQTEIDVENDERNHDNSDDILPKIKIIMTITLILFTLQPYSYIIMFGIYSMPEYHTRLNEKRIIYMTPLRIIPMSLVYVFFFLRLKAIFDESIYALKKRLYIVAMNTVLILYYMILIYIELMYLLTIEFNFHFNGYDKTLIVFGYIMALIAEISFSVSLTYIALQKLKQLRIKTAEISKLDKCSTYANKQETDVLKVAANKIFILTMVAALSTQMIFAVYVLYTGSFHIQSLPVLELNLDAVINSLCVVLNMYHYKQEYNILCYPCILCSGRFV